jgi:hypothetical protein
MPLGDMDVARRMAVVFADSLDGAVMVCEINEVNDRPVGNPQEQGVMNIAASFSLNKKPR